MGRGGGRQEGPGGSGDRGGKKICLWFVWGLKAKFWLMRRKGASLWIVSSVPSVFFLLCSDVVVVFYRAIWSLGSFYHIRSEFALVYCVLIFIQSKELKKNKEDLLFPSLKLSRIVFFWFFCPFSFKRRRKIPQTYAGNQEGQHSVCFNSRISLNVLYLYVLPGVHISQLNRQTYVFFLLHEWANAVQSAEEVTIETSLC